MPVRFSKTLSAARRGRAGALMVNSLDFHDMGLTASPVVLLDEFQVRGHPFAPHPHAGLSAITYLLEDSPSPLRSRDSLGGDHVVGPGGLVWTQAGRGVMHEELPAEPDGRLHGMQIFVNARRANKSLPPTVFVLDGDAVPVWSEPSGDSVRVVVGAFGGVTSPVAPTEAFRLLDITLKTSLEIELSAGEMGYVYGLGGEVALAAETTTARLGAGQAILLSGEGIVRLQGGADVKLLFLAGAEIPEPVVRHGPFIMSDRQGVAEATARFQSGGMGRLERWSS